MKRLKRYLEIRYDKHKKKWDTVGALVGDEGVGKSNLALHMLEEWIRLNGREPNNKDIKHMCLTGKDFSNDLSDSIPNEMTIFDEAGELDSRRAMSHFNVGLSQAYKVIRADRIFTILVLPEFFDLEPRFRNRRCKFLICVYKRGSFAFWGKAKTRLISLLNQDKIIKHVWVVEPDFYDNFPIYNGVMLPEYERLKEKKTKEARLKVKEIFDPTKKETEFKYKVVKNMRDKGMTFKEIGGIFEVTDETIRNWNQIQKPNRHIT